MKIDGVGVVFDIFKILFYVYECLPAHMPVHHVCEVPTHGQKRAPDSLELELQILVSHHMDVGKPRSSERVVNPLNDFSILQPQCMFT